MTRTLMKLTHSLIISSHLLHMHFISLRAYITRVSLAVYCICFISQTYICSIWPIISVLAISPLNYLSLSKWLVSTFPRLLSAAPVRGPHSALSIPFLPVLCIFICHANQLHILPHHSHKPRLWPSSFTLAWQLHFQNPSPDIPCISPPCMIKPSRSRLCVPPIISALLPFLLSRYLRTCLPPLLFLRSTEA